MASSVLVIGLDGVDFRYLDRFSDSLEHLETLRADGTEATLDSTHPPWTGCAWPSVYTGVGPSHHGVFDFFDYADAYPDTADVVSRHDVAAPAIWEYLSARARRSLVVNVPITHPAEALEGILLPGYLAPTDADGYPPGIRSDLSAAIGEPYEIYSEFETTGDTDRKIDGYEALIRHRADAAEHLLETEEWDFAFVQVQKTDAVFHNSSSPTDFRRIYGAADDLVGRLIDASGPDVNVVVCSDHGMGPVTGYTVYVNELLHEHGYVTKTADTTSRSLAAAKGGSPAEPTAGAAWLGRLLGATRRAGLTPGAIYRGAQRLGVEDQLRAILPSSFIQSFQQGVDWSESVAYCRRGSEQGIRLNLEGRDPEGVLAPERYEQVREEIIQLLSGLTTPEDEPVFEFVCRREERYDGPYAEDACDILFRTTGMNHVVSASLYGRTLLPADAHNHKDTGVFLASGPDVESVPDGVDLSLLDIAPIVFSLLEEPVPERLPGDVPGGLLSTPTDRRAYDDVAVAYEGTYSQDNAEVTDRLRDLGYL